MKLKVAIIQVSGATSSLVWPNTPQSRDIRIRLTIVTGAGFWLKWGGGYFEFCWLSFLSDGHIRLQVILSEILHIRHLTQGLAGRKSSVMGGIEWIITTALSVDSCL